MFSIIDNPWFTRCGTGFVIIYTETGISTVIMRQIFIRYILKMHFISCKLTDCMSWNFSYQTCFQSKLCSSGSNIKFCTTNILFKNLCSRHSFVCLWRKTKKKFSKCEQIIFFRHCVNLS